MISIFSRISKSTNVTMPSTEDMVATEEEAKASASEDCFLRRWILPVTAMCLTPHCVVFQRTHLCDSALYCIPKDSFEMY